MNFWVSTIMVFCQFFLAMSVNTGGTWKKRGYKNIVEFCIVKLPLLFCHPLSWGQCLQDEISPQPPYSFAAYLASGRLLIQANLSHTLLILTQRAFESSPRFSVCSGVAMLMVAEWVSERVMVSAATGSEHAEQRGEITVQQPMWDINHLCGQAHLDVG